MTTKRADVRRLSTRRVDSAEVQGEGSFLTIKSVNYGHGKKLRLEYKDMTDEEQLFENERILIECIVDWNWVDDEGAPLPLPKDDPTVLDRLTQWEHAFIGEAMEGTQNRKNS